MSNFPFSFDDDTTLPFVNDNLTEIGAEAINAVRDAVFNTQQYLGLGASGTTNSIAQRLGVSINPDGTIKASAITSLGLVTLPIQNNQIASNAEIQESKLKLDYRTSDLYNYIKDLSRGVNTSIGWISASGSKLEPHLLGFAYRHILEQIDVTDDPNLALKNKFRDFRDNTSAFKVINDLNDELLYHQFADGYELLSPQLIITNDGTSSYPSNFAHLSKGIFLDTDRFATIPQTANDLQKFADYIDSASIFLLGTRIQNLYSNGISRESRSSSLVADGYGQELVSPTNVITYLLGTNNSSQPVDDINNGDDIIEFKPSDSDSSSNAFDAKFALVKPGDIVKVNYDGVEISHVIKEKKYAQSVGNKKYLIRIDGKNIKYSTTATARIDKPLLNLNKYGTLSVAAANNNFSGMPSLIVGMPRGASATGIGFNPDLIDSTHYILYLAIYPTGNPADGYTILPGIDVSGNAGATPGKYTLSSVVETVNTAFRQPGYNYRFIAFQYQGEFGVALADSYNNVAFSILSGVLASNGTYDQAATDISFPNNIIGLSTTNSLLPVDALGFGPYKGNIASPPYIAAPASAEASQIPTKLFVALKRNNFYVNGVEIEKLALDQDQIEDKFGDGYWIATVQNKNIYPGPSPVGRVETTYRIPIIFSTSELAVGKTIVVQPIESQPLVNFGRYIIKNINCNCGVIDHTDITVYDAVHANGVSPATTLDVGAKVAIYFDKSSVSFNSENSSDLLNISPFKRHFEVLINQSGKTFTHERARINASNSTLNVNGTVPLYTYSELNKLNILKVSSKLRGYQFGIVNKIALKITEFTSSGSFTGYLCSYNGLSESKKGPITQGNIGTATRFYDETNIDYIDIIFDTNVIVSAFVDQYIDFQLFPTLSLDNEIMMIATCQVNDVTKKVTHLRDERQFGNISEKDLTTSALGFISNGERLLHSNGVIRGFDLETIGTNPNYNQVYLTGGAALVNGKFVLINQQTVAIPIIREIVGAVPYNINWALCINDKSEYQPIPLLDYDATLGTPSNSDRLFNAYNTVNGQSYVLESSTFSNILNNRKDLTILYIVSSVVVPADDINPLSITLNLTDARKYITDADSNLDLKLTSAKSQGNFKNVESIFNWLKYNSYYNSNAIIKGADSTSGVINNSIILDFSSSVIIDGLNNATLIMNSPVTIGSNFTFKNTNITFKNLISVIDGASNILFENCNITIDNELTSGTPVNNIIIDILNGSNIKFINCNVTASYFVPAASGALFRLNNVNNFSVTDCSIDLSFNAPKADGYVPGTMFIIKNTPGVNILDSTFEGNFVQFIRNTNSNELTVKNCHVTSSYAPDIDNVADIFDSTTDAINIDDGLPSLTFDNTIACTTGRGYIYSKVDSTLDNIIIDNVSFVFAPDNTSTVLPRFSFINFELSNNTSILKNVLISNCKFGRLQTNIGDKSSAISIINTLNSPIGNTNPQPLLQNVIIENNYCSDKQNIIISSKLSSSDTMVYPGLVTEKCSIKDNTCGYIGYWTSSAAQFNSYDNTSFTDKDSLLVISGNDCHHIISSDHRGKYFRAVKLDTSVMPNVTINQCSYPSGNVIIENNTCNGIHTCISFEENSSLKILNNKLSAIDTVYFFFGLMNLFNTLESGYAITVRGNKHVIPVTQSPGQGNDVSCVISNNTTSAGYWLRSNFVSETIKYQRGYILCTASCNITENTLKGIDNVIGGDTQCDLIVVGGKVNIIKNNKVYRQGNSIHSYVKFDSLELPTWDYTNAFDSFGIITDNFFDSPYLIGDVNTGSVEWHLSSVTVPGQWLVEKNINQTEYVLVPLTTGSYPHSNAGLIPGGAASNYINDLYAVTSAANANGSHKSLVLSFIDLQDPPVNRAWTWQESLNKYLPNNVKILQAQIGVRSFGNDVQNIAGQGVSLYINKYLIDTMQTTSASPFSYVNLDHFANWSDNDAKVPDDITGATPFAKITSSQLNASPAASTVVSTIDFTAINPATGGSGTSNLVIFYTTNYRYPITATVNINFTKIAGIDANLLVSPISIKYRW